MQILDQYIEPGQSAVINLEVANLHTRTPITVPILVERAIKPGPTLLLLGGIHGDEINGVEIVRRVISKKIKPDRGTLICIPVFNVFGFLNLSRQFPDGRDLNRVFPGNSKGSLASRFAHAFTTHIVPVIDYAVDFHTGGAERSNSPQVRCVFKESESLEFARAFGAKFILNSKRIPKSVRQTLFKMNKISLLYEGGKSGHFDENVIEIGVKGAIRIMHHLDLLDGDKPELSAILIDKSKWIRAPHSGMFHNRTENAAYVKKNQILGKINDPYGEFENIVRASNDGYILCINTAPIVNRGDALYHISTKHRLD